MKYLRRTTSAAEGNGLDTTISKHSAAMHNERQLGQRLGHHDQVLATHKEGCRKQRPGATIKYLRFTTSGAAVDGLSATIELLRAAHGQVTARRLRRRSWHHDQVPATHNERRRGQRLVHFDQTPARRRGPRPGHHNSIPATSKCGRYATRLRCAAKIRPLRSALLYTD
jgi:hypothetical protein